MASYSIQSIPAADNSQRPKQVYHQDGSNISSSKKSNGQKSSSAPFFLKRPSISSELASRLIPIDVDIHTKKNMDEHSTNHYDIPGLVLRRGQPFSFTVTFNRDFDAEQHQLYVRLAIGSRSMISKRTQIRLLVDGTSNGNGWSAKKIPIEGEEDKKNNRISLQIDSPSDAIIGKYALLIEVRPMKVNEKDFANKQNLTLFLLEVDIYFLFNPWKKDDVCALSSPEQIAEYVMNEHGQIYLGTSDEPRPLPWYFGQFERPALHTALALLDNAHLPSQNRIDPAVILRILSSRICSNPGVNTGIFPSSIDVRSVSRQNHGYTSSTAILKQYLALNCRSIHGGSGSNWQHAAILCTLSRALGIPCRITTVYDAACRADGTENNDIHWDTKQRPLRRLNSDLICPSHVWNECWMRRNDFPTREQDWQIIDSTPVLMCDGIRRTGPCPVSALKQGALGFRWDSPFIHSSINGNKSHWIVYPDGYMELLDVQEKAIGTKIITRSLTNEFEPEDITDRYKEVTKSLADHDTLATRLGNDVSIELNAPKDNKFGDNIILEFTATNKSSETRTLSIALTICVTMDPGHKSTLCFTQPNQMLTLEGSKNDNLQLKIAPDQYVKHGRQENIILKYYVHAQIKETNQIFIRDDNIVFNRNEVVKPMLEEDVVEIGKPLLMKVQITNTLLRSLNNGRIYIDGLGINQMLRVNRSFAPKESTTLRTKLYPARVGLSRLYVTFIADNICSLTQSVPVEIVPEPITIRKPDESNKDQDEAAKKQDKQPEGPADITQDQGKPTENQEELLTKAPDQTTEKQDDSNKVQEKPTEKEVVLAKTPDETKEKQDDSNKVQEKPAEKEVVLAKTPDETKEKQDDSNKVQEKPAETEDKPADISKNQDEAAKKSEELTENQLKSTESQDESPKLQEESSKKPDESTEKKEEIVDKPAQATADQEKPAETQDKPVEDQAKPVETQEKPVETQQKPAEIQEKPVETQEKPAETQEKLAETQEKPAETQEKPAETQDKPAETQEKPAETQEKPAELQDKPAENPEEVTKVPDGSTTKQEEQTTKKEESTEKQSEIKTEEKGVTPLSDTPSQQGELTASEVEKPSPIPLAEDEKPADTVEKKTDSSSTGNEEKGADESQLKKQPDTATDSTAVPPDSTSSVDKDKVLAE